MSKYMSESEQIVDLQARLEAMEQRRVRDFVDGAKWWEYEKENATMWASDRAKAEISARKHFDAQVLRSALGLDDVKEKNMNTYLVDITVRVHADDQESAWYLANERASRAFDEALVHIDEPLMMRETDDVP